MYNSELNKSQFPIITNKPQSFATVFNLIKMKKAELTRKIEQCQKGNVSLPHLHEDEIKGYSELQYGDEVDKSQSFGTEVELNKYYQEKVQSPKDEYKSSKKGSEALMRRKKVQDILTNNINYKQLYSISKPSSTHHKKNKNFNNPNFTSLEKSNQIINRTRTQQQIVESRKLTNITKESSTTINNEEQKRGQFDEVKKNFQNQIRMIPRLAKDRNEENLSKIINCLKNFNPFFNRIDSIVATCLLKLGKITFRESSMILFKPGDEIKSLFIILLGKVKLVDSKTKRVCQTGETFLEEILFIEKSKHLVLEKVKNIGAAYLLQMRMEQYRKLKEELIKFGYRVNFIEMQAILKRNYIVKNTMRNKNKMKEKM